VVYVVDTRPYLNEVAGTFDISLAGWNDNGAVFVVELGQCGNSAALLLALKAAALPLSPIGNDSFALH